jgi:tripartite-type tricarboxylate transporter receptor subunit TctC
MTRRLGPWMGFALAALLNANAFAQSSWPDRPIQLIVPFPAGGGVDVIARPFAEVFGELSHQSIVVMPKPGASGTIGVASLAMAKPDGYTLAFTPNGPITIQPHVLTLSYKAEEIIPVCQAFAVQYVLAVRGDSPYRTLAEFIDAAKAQPGRLSYGFGGVATSPHLAMSQLVIGAKLDVLGVPFSGDPQAILALRGGQIDSATLNVGGAKAQGFRILATFADVRQAEIPDVPTMKELGYDVVSGAFGGLFAPKGTPANIISKIDAACAKTVADERYQRAAVQASQQPLYRNAADFARVVTADYNMKRDVVKRAGVKAP